MMRLRSRAGFVLIDLLMGTVLSAALALAMLMISISVTRGAGAINASARMNTVLSQAADRFSRDALAASQANQPCPGWTTAADSLGNERSTWILNPQAGGTTCIVYDFLASSTGQLRRLVQPLAGGAPLRTEVVGNGFSRVAFQTCPPLNPSFNTDCVQLLLQLAADPQLANPATGPVSLVVRAVYRNSP